MESEQHIAIKEQEQRTQTPGAGLAWLRAQKSLESLGRERAGLLFCGNVGSD